ncbi:uncharacterized protein TrAFT101_010148 [Trichoderma asperellum]|uniref:uncharacterized protein n=1 Tax=Trichoderma asperellum TaxID=101201 RepID=UPI00331747B6|nr:hypothetical protein TrAFT101_010148 [Trichoderma asperellum]
MAYRFNCFTANPGGLYPEDVFGILAGPSQDNSGNRQPAELDKGNSNDPPIAQYNPPFLPSFRPTASLPPIPSFILRDQQIKPDEWEMMARRFAIPGQPVRSPPAYHFPPPDAPCWNRNPTPAAQHQLSNNTRGGQQEHEPFTWTVGGSGENWQIHPGLVELRKMARREGLYPGDWITAAKEIMVLQSQVKDGIIRGVPVVPEIREQTLDRLQKLRSASRKEIANFNAAIDKIVDDAKAAHAAAVKKGKSTAAYPTVVGASFSDPVKRDTEAALRNEAERQKNAVLDNQTKPPPYTRGRIKNERRFTLTDKKRTLSDGDSQCESY